MKFKATPDHEFIQSRDKQAKKLSQQTRGADCEFIEYHQAIVDQFQTIYEGMEYDTTHTAIGRIDYKQFAQNGVHVSTWIKARIDEGIIDALGIWRWLPNNRYVELEEDVPVQYEILEYVNAQEAMKHWVQTTPAAGRFKYPFN